MKPWKKIETKETHELPFFKVIMDKVLTPGGEEREYSWIKMNRPFVMIIPIGPNKKIWMVESYRYPIQKFVIEFPGGVVDPEEIPFTAAKREMEEEIHLKSDEWIDLGLIEEIGVSVEAKGSIFLAKNVEPVISPKIDPLDKDMFTIHQYTTNEVSSLITNDRITDTATIAAFCRAHLNDLLD